MVGTRSTVAKSHVLSILLLLILTVTVMNGCNRGPVLAKADGTVQLNGVPLDQGLVMFVPLGGGNPAKGTIDEQGGFRLGTFSGDDGAVIGLHRVTVISEQQRGDKTKRMVYRSPPDATFEIVASQQNTFGLDISLSGGWQEFTD